MVKVRTLGDTACMCLQFAAPQLTPAVKNAKNSDQGELLYKKHQRVRAREGGGMDGMTAACPQVSEH